MPAFEKKENLNSFEGTFQVFFNDPNNAFKYAKLEQERRFLLRSIPEDMLGDKNFIRIIDRYIPSTRLRLRRMESPLGDALIFKLGQKYRPSDFEDHQAIMTNLYLNEVEYKVLEALGGPQLAKRRYPYLLGKYKYAIDVFEDTLAGLILAEIEGGSAVDLTSIPVPRFALQEVTSDPAFSGANLAGLTGVELNKILSAHGIK
jgi:CYTH domain-containing protein